MAVGADLLERAQAGDDAAFGELLSPYRRELQVHCYRVMWANLHLLFWLSLIPVLTGWIGQQHGQPAPAATYAVVCLAAALAFMMLVRAIIRADGTGSPVAAATGRNVKPLVSLAFYAAAAGLAFVSPWVSYALFAAVAAMWFVPFRRLSR